LVYQLETLEPAFDDTFKVDGDELWLTSPTCEVPAISSRNRDHLGTIVEGWLLSRRERGHTIHISDVCHVCFLTAAG
jgi:hypothetical protein